MEREQILLITHCRTPDNAGSIKDHLKDGWIVVCAVYVDETKEIHYILERPNKWGH